MKYKIYAFICSGLILASLSSCSILGASSNSKQTHNAETGSITGEVSESLEDNATSFPDKANKTIVTLDETVSSADIKKIDVDYKVADIQIIASDENDFLIKEVSNVSNEDTYGQLTKENDTIKITQPKDLSNSSFTTSDFFKNNNDRSTSITLTISIPTNFMGNLQISSNVSDIQISEGLSLTKIEISTNVSDVSIGSIDSLKELELSANVADVAITCGTALEKLDVSVNTGDFSVSIPSVTAFSYDIETSVGEVDSDFFTSPENTKVSSEVSGTVGVSPSLTLTVSIDIGDIQVKKI